MRKFFSFSLSLIILLQIFLLSSGTAQAVENCPVTTFPSPVTTNDKFINITIDTSKVLPADTSKDPKGSKYLVRLDNTYIRKGTSDQRPIDFPTSNGTISIQHVNREGQTEKDTSKTFDAKPYTVSVLSSPRGETVFCTSSSTPEYKTSGGTCGIKFPPNQGFTVNDDIVIQGTSLGKLEEDRNLIVRRDKVSGEEARNICLKAQELSTGKNIGKLEAGVYYAQISKSCGGIFDLAPEKMCFTPFLIGEKGGFGPSPGPLPTPEPICPKGLGFCETALGKIYTDPANFVKGFFGILLSLAGGIAIILIIISGYRLMSSGGNPEKVQAAREQLTSAIVGLLFIIFSLSILQIIGVDILHIPGLDK